MLCKKHAAFFCLKRVEDFDIQELQRKIINEKALLKTGITRKGKYYASSKKIYSIYYHGALCFFITFICNTDR